MKGYKHKVKHVEDQGFEGCTKQYIIYKDGVYYTSRSNREAARRYKREIEASSNAKVVIIQNVQFNNYVR